jgi:hypothetical protein
MVSPGRIRLHLHRPWPVALGLAKAPNLTMMYPCLRDTFTGRPILDNDALGIDTI